MLPVLRRRHPAVRAARASPTGRTPTSKLWKHHAAQPQADRINDARRTSAASRGSRRYGGLISASGSSPRACSCSRRTPRSTTAMDHWVEAADWIVWQLCGALRAQRLHRRLQGHPTRTARYPSRDFLAALNPDFADFVDGQARRTRSASSATAPGALTAEAAAWTGLPEGIAVAVGNVDAHVTAPAAQAIEPGQMVAIMGTSTCHVMNGDALRRGARHVRRRRRRHRARACTATRPGSAASATSSPGSSRTRCPAATSSDAAAAGRRVHEHLTELACRAAGRRARPGRARLAQRQPVGAGRPRAVRRRRRPDARDPARGRLPGAARGHRVRHPRRSSRRSRAAGRAGRPSSSSPAGC